MNEFTRPFGLLCLCAVMLLTACGGAPKVRIGVSQCSSDDWRNKMNNEMLIELFQHPGVQAEILSAEDDNANQIKDIEHFIKEGVDVLVVSPREAAAVTPAIEKARSKGIKVLVFDREMSSDDYDLFYGADNKLVGQNVARYLASILPSKGGEVNVLEIRGLDDSSPARGRHDGFVETVESTPGLTLLASVEGDWNPGSARRLADSLLRAHPQANAIYAHNDRMALAAREAAENQGRSGMVVVGVDGAPSIGLKGVKEGKLDATFLYPTHGSHIIRNAIDLAEGRQVPHRIITSSAMPVDRTNIDLQLYAANALQESVDSMRSLNTQMVNFRHTKDTMKKLLICGLALLFLAACVVFLVLRLYWDRRRSQEELAQRNAELQRRKEELESLNDQLKEATASKMNFFTNVSHDLRTPLSLISAPIDELRAQPELPPRERGMLDIAAKNVRILRRMINQILDFQRYEHGKLKLSLQNCDVTKMLREWTESFQAAARSQGIKLSFHQKGEECSTAVDPEKLERILFNLLGNAFKFTPPNGRVTVGVDTTPEESFQLTVTDTGRGIAKENLPHLFERFFQGREGNAGGSGIGLVVVKSFVELHGGTISVESVEGVGTIFKVSLPKRTVSAPVREKEAEAEKSREVSCELGKVEIADTDPEVPEDGKPVVLVVDDNEDMRSVLRQLLGTDCHVISAPNGEAGIRLANKYVPDCMVCDVMMPGLDGLEVTRRLKADTITSHIPILLLTACALDEQRAEGYDSGADGYVSKPFDPAVLKSRVKSLIENRRRLLEGAQQGVPGTPPSPGKSAQKSVAPKGTAAKGAKPGEQNRTVDPFSELDSTFYRNFVAMVERDLSDPTLSVEEMASRMGMSRVQFYRKLKALTNYSPVDLLKIFRLRKAKELLASDDETTVAEIAYKVGFSSPSYFAKCFREQFGELPSELQGRTSRLK